jgi:hypothetical protein
LKWIDPLGLYTEVYTFQPVGWGSSSFGHTAININGTVYSWGPNGLWTGPAAEYLSRNDFRSAVGAVINLTPQQETTLQDFINNYGNNNEYGTLGSNCGDPIEEGLESLGFDLGINLYPVGLGEALEDAGLVTDYNFYSPNPNHPKPNWFDNAPWAR